MDSLTEKPAPKKAPEKPLEADPKDAVLAALAARDQIVSRVFFTKAERKTALEEADRALALAARNYQHKETFDPTKEPVMAAIADLARRSNVGAMRLLLGGRTKMTMPESGDKDKLWGPIHVGWNDVSLIVPRAKLLTLPDPIAEVLIQSQGEQ